MLRKSWFTHNIVDELSVFKDKSLKIAVPFAEK